MESEKNSLMADFSNKKRGPISPVMVGRNSDHFFMFQNDLISLHILRLS